MPPTATTQRLRFLERMLASEARVDREAGVIRNVKVIGVTSSNGRVYPVEVLRKAARLYEDVQVNVDHPGKTDHGRRLADRFGSLRSIRATDAGLFGDLHYLKAHPLAPQVTELAERFPDKLGLSHNADGNGRRLANGAFVVESIQRVISVDLVADPASTVSLFEDLGFDPAPAKHSDGPTQGVIDQDNRDGAGQAETVVRKLFARLMVGVTNDLDLSAEAKTKLIAELLDDQDYMIKQLAEFGRFYIRYHDGQHSIPKSGDPTLMAAGGEEVLAEQVSRPWRNGAFADHLRRANAAIAPAAAADGVRTGGYQRGNRFVEHLRKADVGTIATPSPATSGKPSYEKGKKFAEHLKRPERRVS